MSGSWSGAGHAGAAHPFRSGARCDTAPSGRACTTRELPRRRKNALSLGAWGLGESAMGKSIVRLKDIADRTGFSTNTVSLALRGSPRIPQQTREIIQRAAAELNYLPNAIAKSLVSR